MHGARSNDPEEGLRLPGERPAAGERLGLVKLLVALGLSGAILHQLASRGALTFPDLPNRLPDPGAIRAFLTSSPGPEILGSALPWLFLGACLFWLWLAASVVLQAAVATLELLTRGAGWVRALRRLVDRATATVARRLVTGATATVLVTRLSLKIGRAHV